MVADYIGQYVSETIALITSMSMAVKSSSIASIVNDVVKAQYGESAVNELYPETWKYYMNISGDYHPTDTVMTVTSLDTLEVIDFTKANLEEHTQTAEGYRLGTRLHKVLLKRYPTQTALIYGILYPADIGKAISAKDGTILAHDARYVEDQELTLVYDLQEWLYRYLKKFNVSAFEFSGDLVVAARHSEMVTQMVSKVMALRQKRVLTNEAHSFHVRAYLASHGHLDRFYDYMKPKQVLWLYRNLRYIERNQGKTEVFEAMITNLLNSRFIPISDLSVRHTTEFTDDSYVEVHARAKIIGKDFSGLGTTYKTLQDLYDYEIDLNPGNAAWLDAYADDVERDFQLSRSSIVQTKLLASEMVDYTDSEVYPLLKIAMDEWGQRSFDGTYTAAITFVHPSTGEEVVMSVKDAFVYIWYITVCMQGYTPEYLPSFQLTRVERYPYPSVEELTQVVPRHEDPYRYYDFAGIAKQILDDRPNPTRIKSTKNFYKHAYALFEAHQRDQFMISHMDTATLAGVVKDMTERTTRAVSLEVSNTASSMTDWLTARVLPVYDLETQDAAKLITKIYTLATGYDITDPKRLPNIQRAMIAIMRQLSSYTVQFVSRINEDPILTLNPTAIRPERVHVDEHNTQPLRSDDRVTFNATYTEDWLGVNTEDVIPVIIEHTEATATVEVSQTSELSLLAMTNTTHQVVNPGTHASWTEYPDPIAFMQSGAVGAETFNALTDAVKRQIAELPLP